ncbi:MAG: DUF2085 domain-containing protein [Bacillota bacterium]|jgi:uncharacterized membrane protein|uniref:DUF2085 domain-containing protein n=1 Tax=Bacillus sp. RO2 TaxID=2723913 RepID=UPI00145DD796|nr:DUF2085 domain-containing protein [Bacillus sp. RO2]MEA3322494.1 DUF2085 domain-containing protein [Bacillota bacterium]NMH74182.1 DUF2085 domain-containing protein [Bacillus sp. RO2]
MKEYFDAVITLRFFPCHRKKERSLVIRGKQFPMCYRCMSILLGYLAVVPLLWLAADVSFIKLFVVGVLLNFPMVIDGYTQLRGWRVSNNFLRSLTGLISGMGMSCIIVAGSFQFHRAIKGFANLIEFFMA